MTWKEDVEKALEGHDYHNVEVNQLGEVSMDFWPPPEYTPWHPPVEGYRWVLTGERFERKAIE